MKNLEFKAVGKRNFMGFQWYRCIVDGIEVCKYRALDADHARRIHNKNWDSIWSQVSNLS